MRSLTFSIAFFACACVFAGWQMTGDQIIDAPAYDNSGGAFGMTGGTLKRAAVPDPEGLDFGEDVTIVETIDLASARAGLDFELAQSNTDFNYELDAIVDQVLSEPATLVVEPEPEVVHRPIQPKEPVIEHAVAEPSSKPDPVALVSELPAASATPVATMAPPPMAKPRPMKPVRKIVPQKSETPRNRMPAVPAVPLVSSDVDAPTPVAQVEKQIAADGVTGAMRGVAIRQNLMGALVQKPRWRRDQVASYSNSSY